MRTYRSLLLAAIAWAMMIFGAVPTETVHAQPGVRPVRVFNAFDVDATTFVYCVPATPVAFVACDTLGAGAGADDGWVNVRGMSIREAVLRIDAMALTAGTIEFTVEGRWTDAAGTKATATLISPIDKAAAGPGQVVVIAENVEEMRIGVRIDGTDDADAVPESVTIHVESF
jgi:hypothetical protein